MLLVLTRLVLYNVTEKYDIREKYVFVLSLDGDGN
jgi:hypothetical protein